MKRILPLLLAISLLATNLFAFSGFDDIFAPTTSLDESAKPTVSGSGSVGADVGVFLDDLHFSEQLLRLNLLVDSQSFKSEAALSYDALDQSLQVSTASVTYFFDWGQIEAGLLKEEWGSADGLHVVDVLNAFDYSKGLSDDLASMKRSEFMVGTTLYKGSSSLQLYFKPTFTPGLSAMEGRWSLLPQTLTLTIKEPPKTDSWEYAQFALRGRTSIGGVDLGLLYYKGQMAQPGAVLTMTGGTTADMDIVYTPYQLFGTEATYLLGQFTFMAEGGYLLSKDRPGSDPTLYNSKWVYLGGVSYLEPTSNLYLALMYNGHFVEHYDKVEPNALDVDQAQAFDNKAYGNTLTLAMEVPLFRERVKVRLGAIYQIETEGYALLPSIGWQVSDTLLLECKAVVYGSLGSKSSVFKTWEENDSLTIGMTHYF